MSVPCIVCGSDHWVERKERPKAWRTTNESFSMVECTLCGLICTYPVVPKDKVGAYYNFEQYDSHKNSSTKSAFDRAYKLIQKVNFRLKYNTLKSALKKNTENLSLLDYGCGNGSFLKYAKAKFHKIKGVEFAPGMIEYCVNSGLEVVSEEVFKNQQERFDVITLFHVFEHLYNPDDYLMHFKNHLKENGLLLIAVPNPNAFDAKFYRDYWAAWDVPIHLHHFKEQTLIRFLEKFGFKLKLKKPMLFDAFYVSILSEKIKKTRPGVVRGAVVGLVSNLFAFFTGQYSSKMYVFEKITELE